MMVTTEESISSARRKANLLSSKNTVSGQESGRLQQNTLSGEREEESQGKEEVDDKGEKKEGEAEEEKYRQEEEVEEEEKYRQEKDEPVEEERQEEKEEVDRKDTVVVSMEPPQVTADSKPVSLIPKHEPSVLYQTHSEPSPGPESQSPFSLEVVSPVSSESPSLVVTPSSLEEDPSSLEPSIEPQTNKLSNEGGHPPDGDDPSHPIQPSPPEPAAANSSESKKEEEEVLEETVESATEKGNEEESGKNEREGTDNTTEQPGHLQQQQQQQTPAAKPCIPPPPKPPGNLEVQIREM